MSKAHMIVLSLVGEKPMHGYQIGQLVDQLRLPLWEGITLPAIYKAIQTLEKKKFIRGEEVRESNNPPRMVFNLESKGRKYLAEMVRGYLEEVQKHGHEWWFTLIFAKKVMHKAEMLELIKKRMSCIEDIGKLKHERKEMLWPLDKDKVPFVHLHMMALGERCAKMELKSLQEFYDDIASGNHDSFFLAEGEML
jgi:DNA-binding PadR family transcriptional regulator